MIDFFSPTPQYQTPQQAEPLEQTITPEERQGLMSRLYESSIGGLGYIGKILDKAFGGRALRGVLGGRPEELASILPFSDTLGLTNDANVVQGTDLLRQAGLTSGDGSGIIDTGLGLLTEMALDPSSYLTFGASTAAGKAARLLGNQAKGLTAGIRSGERGLVGIGLPFREPAESMIFGTGAPTADVLEMMGAGIGRVAKAPVNAAEWAAQPAEAIFGVNPVTKLREGAATAGQWGRAMFNRPTQGAWSEGGQDLAEEIWSPTADAFRKPFNELHGELGHMTDKLIQKYGPDAAEDIRRANVIGMELPTDIEPFRQKIGRQYEEQILNLTKGERELQEKMAKSIEDGLIKQIPMEPGMREVDDLGRARTPRVEMPGAELTGQGDIPRYRPAANAMTKAERDAIQYWEEAGHEAINDSLRGTNARSQSARGAAPDPALVKRVVSDLDSAIAKSPLDKDTLVYRGVGPGQLDVDPAPIATTTDRAVAERFAKKYGGHVQELLLPAGTKAAKVPGKESELLLARGTDTGPLRRAAQAPINLSDPQSLKNAILDVADQLDPLFGTRETRPGWRNKFFHSDVFEAIKHRLPQGWTLDDYKRYMSQNRGEHKLDISRVDLPQTLSKEQFAKMQASEAKGLSTTHTISIENDDLIARMKAKSAAPAGDWAAGLTTKARDADWGKEIRIDHGDGSFLDLAIGDGVAHVITASAKEAGKGHGQQMYDLAIQKAKESGATTLFSAAGRTEAADKAWARLAKRYPVVSSPEGLSIDLTKLPQKGDAGESFYRVPSSKGGGDNYDALKQELMGSGFAGKWFSRTRQGNEGYLQPERFQIEFKGNKLDDAADVVEKRVHDVGIGSKTPMYMHPAISAIRYVGDEAAANFQDLKALISDVNQARLSNGLDEITVETIRKGQQPVQPPIAGPKDFPGQVTPLPTERPLKPGRLTKQERQSLAEQINPLDFDEQFKAKEQMWRQVHKVGDDWPVGRTPEVQKQIDALELERGQKLKALELGQAYRAANNPIAMLAKHATPEEVAELTQKWQDIRNIIDTQPELFRQAGGQFDELDDILNPLPRQKAILDKGANESFFAFIKRRGNEQAMASDPTQIRRLDVLRTIPGGTDQVSQLIGDKGFRALAEDAQESVLREMLAGTTTPVKGSPVWDQAKELGQFIRNAPEGYIGKSYFDMDTAKVIRDYGEIQAKRMGTIETVKEGVARHAMTEAAAKAAGVEGVTVKDLLAQVNMTPVDQAQDVWQAMAGAKGVDFKDIQNMVVPNEIAKDMIQMGVAWKSPQAMAPVINAWNVANDWFKTMVTAPFPAFYVRNFISGLFNTWRDGALNPTTQIDMQKMLRGGYMSDATAARLAQVLPAEFGGRNAQQATDRFMELALGHDVAFGRQGQGLGDMTGGMAGLQSYSFPKTTGEVKPLKHVLRDTMGNLLPDKELEAQGIGKLQQYLNPAAIENVGLNVNANRVVNTGRMVGKTSEDMLRGSHFLEKMVQGYIPTEAAKAVKKYHIDYSDLTEFEKKVMKKVIPWYTFSRKNLPPILEDLATKPAKLTTAIRAATGARDPDQFTPQFIAEGATFPLGSPQPGTDRYISSFGLPFEDELLKTAGSALSGNYRRTAQQLLGMGSPYLKAPYEQAFDTQLYSGRRLSDLDASPIASLGGLLPERTAQIATQFVSNTPAARIVSSADRLMDSRKGTFPTLANLLTGARISDVDVERSRLAADRSMLMEALRPSRETKIREDMYIPKDQLQNLDPLERHLYELYLGVQRDMSAHARGTTATR